MQPSATFDPYALFAFCDHVNVMHFSETPSELIFGASNPSLVHGLVKVYFLRSRLVAVERNGQ